METLKKSHYPLKTMAALLIVILAFVAYFLLGYIRSLLEEDVKINLMELAKQNAQIIAVEASMQLNDLSLIGELLQDRFDTLDDPAVVAFLQEKATEKGYYGLMVATPEGKAYTSSGKTLDISKRIYFKRVKEGIPLISEELVSKLDGADVYIGSVPLYRDTVFIGSIHRVYLSQDFAQYFDVSLFNRRGYLNVINGNGDIIIRSAEKDIPLLNQNYYRELYLLGNGSQAERIRRDLEKETQGFVELQLENKTGFGAYTTMDSIYDWNLVAAVPSEVISENANRVTKLFLFLLSIFILVVMLFFALVQILEKKKKKALEIMAFVDPITGGHSYNKFRSVVPQLLLQNQNQTMAIVKLDIDSFKYINEMHGYDFGNYILMALYSSFTNSLKDGEFVARDSGDNFFALLQYPSLEALEERIQEMVAPVVDDVGIYLGISCGTCIVSDPKESLQLLLDRAELAAKSIKGNSKKTVAIFTEKMNQLEKEEAEIKQAMQKALSHGEFEPFYQPKVNVYLNRIQGAEVLVRWRHPEKGLIAPFRFIPTFEKTGFIVDVDLYMFECVCQKAKFYIENNIPLIPFSVNFSRVHLYNRNFITRIKELVTQYDIPPQTIEVELTESAIFDNLDIILSITLELQEFGFTLSMDDFGSGYSSLNMLKEIPINVLKIDKDFFGGKSENIRREIVIESIVEMAHKLNIKVIAEGVETKEQVEFLKNIDCSMAQGYYYSQPLPQAEFDELYLGTNEIQINV